MCTPEVREEMCELITRNLGALVCARKSTLRLVMPRTLNNRPFPSSPGPLYQNEVKCSAFDMEIIFHSHASKSHFHKKGCALNWPHFESEGCRNSEVAYYTC